MSRLYGVKSHAALCKLLKKYKKNPFCACCFNKKSTKRRYQQHHNEKTTKIEAAARKPIARRSTKHEIKYALNLSSMNEDFNSSLVSFLQQNHLSVYAVEKKIKFENLSGRVDCIFIENVNRRKLFIIDFKFMNSMPRELHMQYIIQLNLYRYIMKRMSEYMMFDFEMYCLIFSSYNKNHINIIKCIQLPEDFVESLISRLSFK